MGRDIFVLANLIIDVVLLMLSSVSPDVSITGVTEKHWYKLLRGL